jgi:hypothetical protein
MSVVDLGRSLMLIGALILGIGLLLTLVDRVPLLGRLPGDIAVQGDHWTLYAPIATSIILSIVLTLAINLVAWLANNR